MEKTLSLRPLPQGLKEGEARIRVLARDHSWNRGNPVVLERIVLIDTRPPSVSVLGAQHYVNQGGVGLITYQTSEETPLCGVKVKDSFFPGYPAGKNRHLNYFALPIDAASDIPVSAVAEDEAGNRGTATVRPIVKARKFKKDKIQVSETFLKNVMPYFMERDQNLKGSLLEVFLVVNRKMREEDHRKIREICQKSAPQVLWSGTFLRLPNSKPMASFGEDRTYWHNGQEIDRQTHLGVDLASLAQSPVPSANSGKVVFAGPLGIYGESVIVDHGCSLFSMYSHLSRIETEVNKEVKKGDSLGRTGATGLAGGDHLHFSMLVNGVFVNPVEWWDDHWIKDNIELKMKMN